MAIAQKDSSPAPELHAGYSDITSAQTKRVRKALGDDKIMAMYEQMLTIRHFEIHAGRAYQQGKIKGFCHLYIGQEAVGVGAIGALGPDDYVVSAYREHGQAIAKGIEPDAVMAELFGKRDGCSGGMGGSMHLFDTSKKFYGGWGIVGGHIPTATGIAWAIKYRKEDAVCLCFFGDGSLHQGAFHEALNMAELWGLPIVFITENNKYGMGTSVERASSVTELEKKALSYDMLHDTIDGQNIFDVWEAIDKAVKNAKNGRPTFLDVKTYRFRGHSMSDPATYRTKDEVKAQEGRDPILTLRAWLVAQKIRTEADLDALEKEVKTKAKASIEFAEASEQPDIQAIYDHVYVQWDAEIEGPSLPDTAQD